MSWGTIHLSVIDAQFGAPTRIHDKKMISNEGKMEKSFLNFKVIPLSDYVLDAQS